VKDERHNMKDSGTQAAKGGVAVGYACEASASLRDVWSHYRCLETQKRTVVVDARRKSCSQSLC
jgi:hypothetical protein